jgi:hypothetical protein
MRRELYWSFQPASYFGHRLARSNVLAKVHETLDLLKAQSMSHMAAHRLSTHVARCANLFLWLVDAPMKHTGQNPS